MTRAHEAWRFTAPVWAYGMGSTVWVIFGLYQRQLGLSTLRRNNYGGPIVIQSGNAEPSDCITYADAGADGTLAKGVLAATSASELALIFWGRLAKGPSGAARSSCGSQALVRALSPLASGAA